MLFVCFLFHFRNFNFLIFQFVALYMNHEVFSLLLFRFFSFKFTKSKRKFPSPQFTVFITFSLISFQKNSLPRFRETKILPRSCVGSNKSKNRNYYAIIQFGFFSAATLQLLKIFFLIFFNKIDGILRKLNKHKRFSLTDHDKLT